MRKAVLVVMALLGLVSAALAQGFGVGAGLDDVRTAGSGGNGPHLGNCITYVAGACITYETGKELTYQ